MSLKLLNAGHLRSFFVDCILTHKSRGRRHIRPFVELSYLTINKIQISYIHICNNISRTQSINLKIATFFFGKTLFIQKIKLVKKLQSLFLFFFYAELYYQKYCIIFLLDLLEIRAIFFFFNFADTKSYLKTINAGLSSWLN